MTLASTSNGCRLVANDGRALPLRSVELLADAGGGLARVRLRQAFANPYADPLHVTYLLPLPADGAVVDFAFVLGGRRITGRVERKADARAAFEQAVLEGRTAALLEQDRSSLFTQELGNVPPGATVEVEIEVEQLLAWVDGGWEWRWPTVVGPRYLGAPGETPDADRVTVDVLDGPLPVTCRATIAVADALTGALSSPSHRLDDAVLAGALDRDVVVRWPVAAPAPGVRIEVARPAGDEAYGLVTLVPPAVAGTPVPRDLCLLLDTSGSMSGAPLAQLQTFSKALVQGLRDGDRLELIEFSSAPRRWRTDVARIDAATRADALRWLDALRAGGGTAMHEAITEALRPLRPEAERQVVVVTDGYIGFEAEVIGRVRKALPRGSRVHAVGIGSAVNRTLTGGIARAGGGHEAIVAPDEPADPAVKALLARTGDPLWIDVTLTGSALRDVAPRAIPDLLAGAPARVAVRLDPAGGELVVTARTPSGTVSHALTVAPAALGTGRRVVATRFAREAVEDLEVAAATGEAVDAAVEALGLRHRIATRLTSWVAATDEATVDPSDPTRRQTMPHALPHGVSAEGVGLRGTVPFQATATAMPAGAPAPAMRQRLEAPRRPALADEKAKDRGRAGGAAAPPPPAEAPEAAAAFDELEIEPGPALVLRGRIVRRLATALIVEVEIDVDVEWDASSPVVVTADGARTTVRALPGTTRSRHLATGVHARIVVWWSGADPVRIELGGLVVELS